MPLNCKWSNLAGIKIYTFQLRLNLAWLFYNILWVSGKISQEMMQRKTDMFTTNWCKITREGVMCGTHNILTQMDITWHPFDMPIKRWQINPWALVSHSWD